jgi:hypothetical protein
VKPKTPKCEICNLPEAPPYHHQPIRGGLWVNALGVRCVSAWGQVLHELLSGRHTMDSLADFRVKPAGKRQSDKTAGNVSALILRTTYGPAKYWCNPGGVRQQQSVAAKNRPAPAVTFGHQVLRLKSGKLQLVLVAPPVGDPTALGLPGGIQARLVRIGAQAWNPTFDKPWVPAGYKPPTKTQLAQATAIGGALLQEA